jgi:hypothetical protein
MRGKFGVSTPGGREVQFKIFVIPVFSLSRWESILSLVIFHGRKPTYNIFWSSAIFIGTPSLQILIWAYFSTL